MVCLDLQTVGLRPSVCVKLGQASMSMLIDTGASFNIWCRSEDNFKALFPQAYTAKIGTYINGLGARDNNLYPVYIIPEFRVFPGVVLHTIPVAVRPLTTQYRMLMGACLLQMGDSTFSHQLRKLFISNVATDFYGVPICSVDRQALIEVRLTTCDDSKLSTISCNQIYTLSRAVNKPYDEIVATVASEGQGKVSGLNPEEIAIRYWSEYKKRHNIVP